MPALIILIVILFRIACYLGIGALLYAVFVSTHLDPYSAVMWGWLLGWPLAMFVITVTAIGVIGLVGVALVFLGFVVFVYYAKFQAWVKRRRHIKTMRARTSQR